MASPVSGRLERPAVLATLSLASFTATLGGSAIAIGLPAVGRELGIGPALLPWVMTAYSLAYGSLLLLSGRLGDFVGRRRVFLVGLAGFAAASVIAGAAPSGWMLFVARAVQGAGAAAFTACALALVADIYSDPSVRNRAIGIFAAAGATGFAAGAVMGGVLTDLLSWRAAFLVPAVLAVMVTVSALAVLPRDDDTDQSSVLDAPGAMAMIAAIGFLLYGLSSVGTNGWASPITLAALGIGAGLAAAFVAVERRSRQPLVPMGVFRAPGVAWVTACLFLFSASAATTYLFAVYLQDVEGQSAWTAGLVYMPLPLAGALLAPLAGGLIDRIGGLRSANVVGVVVATSGWAVMTWLMAGRGPVAALVAGGVAVVIGRVIAIVAMTVRITSSLGGERRGLGAGLVTTAMDLGLATALAAFSAAIGLTGAGADEASAVNGALVAGALVILVLLAAALLAAGAAARAPSRRAPAR